MPNLIQISDEYFNIKTILPKPNFSQTFGYINSLLDILLHIFPSTNKGLLPLPINKCSDLTDLALSHYSYVFLSSY